MLWFLFFWLGFFDEWFKKLELGWGWILGFWFRGFFWVDYGVFLFGLLFLIVVLFFLFWINLVCFKFVSSGDLCLMGIVLGGYCGIGEFGVVLSCLVFWFELFILRCSIFFCCLGGFFGFFILFSIWIEFFVFYGFFYMIFVWFFEFFYFDDKMVYYILFLGFGYVGFWNLGNMCFLNVVL